jgi:hypothetical protein
MLNHCNYYPNYHYFLIKFHGLTFHPPLNNVSSSKQDVDGSDENFMVSFIDGTKFVLVKFYR